METQETDKLYGSPTGQETLMVAPAGRFYAAYSTQRRKKCVYFAGKLVCSPVDEEELIVAVRVLNQAIGQTTPKNLHKDLPRDY